VATVDLRVLLPTRHAPRVSQPASNPNRPQNVVVTTLAQCTPKASLRRTLVTKIRARRSFSRPLVSFYARRAGFEPVPALEWTPRVCLRCAAFRLRRATSAPVRERRDRWVDRC